MVTTLINFLGAAGCVDCDTEYFNGEEWKKIKDFQKDEKVLQYNPDGSTELVIPLNYIKQGTSGLTHFRNNTGSIDQVLSDNHRFIYVTSKGNIAEKPFKDIKEILKDKGSFSAKIITHFKYFKNDDEINLTEDRLRLMVAISADGSKLHNTQWRVRLLKERKIERFRELLKNAQVPIDERVYADGSTNFYVPIEYGCKEFPTYFYKLTGRLREVFCEEILYWDGSIHIGQRDVKVYFSTIKRNADIAQFLLSQDGTRVSIYVDDRIGSSTNSKYSHNSICYSVSVTKTKYLTLGRVKHNKPLILEDYKTKDGLQYCFTVPSGMLVLRRNNNIFITGNSGKSTLGSQLFAKLKTMDYDAEFVTEFVKTWTYTGRKVNKFGQYYIFGKEAENQQRLFNKIDYIIADSPVLLTAFYQHYYWGSDSLIIPCKEFYKFAEEEGVKIVNIFIDRKFKYNPKGRFQTEEQSDEVRKELLNWLSENGFEFYHLKVAIKERLNTILNILNIKEESEIENVI